MANVAVYTKELMEKIEEGSSIKWTAGDKPTEFNPLDYGNHYQYFVRIDHDDGLSGGRLSCWPRLCEDWHGISVDEFVAECARACPKE